MANTKVAFELKADVSGASVSLPGGELYNVGENLKSGKLVLDTSKKKDGEIADALAAHPGVKSVAVSSSKGGDS